MTGMDDLIRSISEKIESREYNIRFVLTGLIQNLIFPHPVSPIDQSGRYAIEEIIDTVFRDTFLNGPDGEEYPDIKISRRLKKSMGVLTDILKERSNKCAL